MQTRVSVMFMLKTCQTGALVAAFVSTVAGHTSVDEFEAGGKTYEGFRQASKQDPGNKSPAWWTNQGWGYQPVYGDKLSQHIYTTLVDLCHICTNRTSAPTLLPTKTPHPRRTPLKHQPAQM